MFISFLLKTGISSHIFTQSILTGNIKLHYMSGRNLILTPIMFMSIFHFLRNRLLQGETFMCRVISTTGSSTIKT
jgi:hypothetical protein